MVTNGLDADIVIVLDRKPIDTRDRWRNNFFMRVLARDNGEVLWSDKRSVAMGRMGGVAGSLVSDLKKRLPPKLEAK